MAILPITASITVEPYINPLSGDVLFVLICELELVVFIASLFDVFVFDLDCDFDLDLDLDDDLLEFFKIVKLSISFCVLCLL